MQRIQFVRVRAKMIHFKILSIKCLSEEWADITIKYNCYFYDTTKRGREETPVQKHQGNSEGGGEQEHSFIFSISSPYQQSCSQTYIAISSKLNIQEQFCRYQGEEF